VVVCHRCSIKKEADSLLAWGSTKRYGGYLPSLSGPIFQALGKLLSSWPS